MVTFKWAVITNRKTSCLVEQHPTAGEGSQNEEESGVLSTFPSLTKYQVHLVTNKWLSYLHANTFPYSCADMPTSQKIGIELCVCKNLFLK